MKARPTVYRGIPMRSRLEARYAAHLGDPRWWRYEPRAYADETGQYLPDFELGDVGHFVEVKPTREIALQQMWRCRVIFSSIPNAVVWVTWPRSSDPAVDEWDFIELTCHGFVDWSTGEAQEWEHPSTHLAAEARSIARHPGRFGAPGIMAKTRAANGVE